MASEIRVNKITNRVGLSTVEYTNTGIVVSGIVTCTELSGLNALSISGVGTASALDINGDIDVDGHTNLDNLSVAGVTTAAGNITISSSHPKLLLTDDTNPDFSVHVNASSFHIRNETVNRNDFRITSDGTNELYYGGIKKLETSPNGIDISGGLTVSGVTTITQDLDVDGNLDIADSVRHSGDINTKITFPANDTISVDTAGSERLRIDSNGRIVIGHDTAQGDLHGPQTTNNRAPFFQLHGANAASAGAALISWKNQAGSYYAPTLYLAHSGSDTIGTNGVLPTNGEFGSIVFSGDDGTDFVKGAIIKARLDGTPGNDDMPGRLEFHTTPDGAQAPIKRMTIQSNGVVKVETSDSSSFNAHFLVNNSESNSGVSLIGSGSSFSAGGWAAVTDAGIIRSSANSSNGLVLQAASGDLRFYVGGNPPAERVRITNVGNVGIATDLSGGGGTYGRLSVVIPSQSGGGALQVMNSAVGSGDGSLSNIVLRSVNNLGTQWADAEYRASQHIFAIQGTEKLRITSGGQVNIGGDYTQTSRLVNINSGSSVGQLQLKGTEADLWMHSTGSGGQWRILGSTGNTTHKFRIYDQTNAGERFSIANDGKVKIGSGDASLALLHIAPATYSLNLQNNGSNKSMILFSKNGTPNDARSWIEGNGQLGGYVAIGAGDDERFKIDSSGYTYHNTTSNGTTNGNVDKRYNWGSDNNLNFGMHCTTRQRYSIWEHRQIGRTQERTAQMSCGETNNQGTVIMYSSTANADVTGGVNLTNGATSWSSNSDMRLKNKTGDILNALEDINKIEPLKFTWKYGPDNNPHVGVSAQSVENVVPEAIDRGVDVERQREGDETEYMKVRYTELIPLSIAAIKELKLEVEFLKAEIASLKSS